MSVPTSSVLDLKKVRAPLRLKGVVKNNAWGKKGAQSRIAAFVSEYEQDTPLAEYWLGTHKNGSAEVSLPDGSVCSLQDLLLSGASLPFMLKILSIDESCGLSIQTHPDLAMAKVLHQRSPEHYPDQSHKPEIGVALSPVEILYGFKSLDDIKHELVQFPMVQDLFSGSLIQSIKACRDGNNKEILKAIFSSLFEVDSARVSRVVSGILASKVERSIERRVIQRIVDVHGSCDAGLLAVMLMNVVSLDKGDAIFIPPNVPHAYLSGDVLECMVCSDNVIRAGLTPKYKDVATLLETCSYAAVGTPSLVSHTIDTDGISIFEMPVDEFKLGLISTGQHVLLGGSSRHRIVLSLEGECSVAQCESGQSVHLSDGESVLIPAESGSYRCTTTTGRAFVAW